MFHGLTISPVTRAHAESKVHAAEIATTCHGSRVPSLVDDFQLVARVPAVSGRGRRRSPVRSVPEINRAERGTPRKTVEG